LGSDPTPFAENKFAVRDWKNLSPSFTHPETYPTCPSMSKPAIFSGKWKDLYADPTPACSNARSSRKLPSVCGWLMYYRIYIRNYRNTGRDEMTMHKPEAW
jgi:hypothetical protein